MKACLLLSLFASCLLLSACETRVAHRRHVVYGGRIETDRVVYRNSYYHDRPYRDDRVYYGTYRGTNRDYPRRSIDRSYGF